MKTTKVSLSKKNVAEYPADLLVTFVANNNDDTIIYDSLLSRFGSSLKQLEEFSGKKEQYIQFYPGMGQAPDGLQCKRLLVLGLGDIGGLAGSTETFEIFRTAGGTIAAQCKKNKVASVAVHIPDIVGLDPVAAGEYLTEGILLGGYQFLKYKKKDDDFYAGCKKVEFFCTGNKSAFTKAVEKGCNSAHSACSARDMANEPGNNWTPAHFAKYAKKIAKEQHLECTVLEQAQLAKLGMGGIIAVNKGSEVPPKLVILDYNPGKNSDTVLLVGKGLTFDSGGISLKPAQGMMDMKYDMCGGAAVLCAMETIAREKPAVRVVAVIPSTENMVSGAAVKPGDIIKHYGGITSEIENTDAEGRLILADALAYGIEKYKPDCVVDLATLTGAVIIALGHHYSGLMTNNDRLAEKLTAAGDICAEPVWRLPLGKLYAKQIESKVADIKNTGGKPGGSITAAEYLHQFVGEVPWAHLDIAGTAWDFSEKSYIPKGPSGVGVRTLIELLRRWENGSLADDES